jgi:hypothetical protein
MPVHLIRFPDRATRVRAIGVFRDVRVTRVRLPGDIMGVADEHIRALEKARIPFIYVSRTTLPRSGGNCKTR